MKKFLLMTVAAFCMCLAACSSGPSGDPAKDARTIADQVISKMESVKTMDDAKNLEQEIEKIQKEYEEFYKAKGEEELQKFKDAFDALENDAEIKAKMEKAQEAMMKVMMENMK